MKTQNKTITRLNLIQDFLKMNDFFLVGEDIRYKEKQFSFDVDIKNKKEFSREEIQSLFEQNGFRVTGNEVLYKGRLYFKKPFLRITVEEDSPYLKYIKMPPSKDNQCHLTPNSMTLCNTMKKKLEICPTRKENSFTAVFENGILKEIRDPNTPLEYCPFCGNRIRRYSQPYLFSIN